MDEETSGVGSNDSIKSDFFREWKQFSAILFSPSVLGLLLIIIALVYFSEDGLESGKYRDLIVIMVSIFSGVVGALISSKWTKYQESGVLATRGKSAVRGLKLLLHHLSTLEERLKRHKVILKTDGDNVSEIVFDESLGWCRALQEETLNSIEEWVGIVPDADIKVQVGELSKLKTARAQLEERVQHLQEGIEKAKDDTGKEKETLKKQLAVSAKKLRELEKNIDSREVEIGANWFSSVSSSTSSSVLPDDWSKNYIASKCDKCGQNYIPTSLSPNCPTCDRDRSDFDGRITF